MWESIAPGEDITDDNAKWLCGHLLGVEWSTNCTLVRSARTDAAAAGYERANLTANILVGFVSHQMLDEEEVKKSLNIIDGLETVRTNARLLSGAIKDLEGTGEVPTVTQLVEATGLTAKRLWRVR